MSYKSLRESLREHMPTIDEFNRIHNRYLTSIKTEPKVITEEIELPEPTIKFTKDFIHPLNVNPNLIIPQRLDQPIYQFPDHLISVIMKRDRKYYQNTSVYKNLSLDELYSYLSNINVDEFQFGANSLVYGINRIINNVKSDGFESDLYELAMKFSKLDMGIIATVDKPADVKIEHPRVSNRIENIINLIGIIQTIRIKSIIEYRYKDKQSHDHESFGTNYHVGVKIHGTSYHIDVDFAGVHIDMFVNGMFFVLRFKNETYINLHNHYNYMVTILESVLNMEIIYDSPEYSDLRPLIDQVNELPYYKIDYKYKVEIMRTLESLMLYAIDHSGAKRSSHIPIIDALSTLAGSEKLYSPLTNSLYTYFCMFYAYDVPHKDTILSSIIKSIWSINVKNLGTASSIHKFMGLSEINVMKGWTKYHNRTSERYRTDKNYMKRLIQLARREFTFGYVKKNKVCPNFKDNKNERCLLLKSQVEHHGVSALQAFTDLSHWEEIIPYDCLDIVQYDDITPYLKDKACTVEMYEAGKNNSVKELIAYLDRPNSKVVDIKPIVKDLISSTKKPGRFHIVSNNEDDVESFMSNHKNKKYAQTVRLVGKEKEQKEEGRFFGIAPFEMKIALSRMMELVKRATKYYRDQIMTSNDMERKLALHTASQMMNEYDVYSLMVDISGHNQSMTYDNCHDLLEFTMNLYGLEGYGMVTQLFENILVVQENPIYPGYYMSIGQKGAIEGWMNQLWGLQSALIMRLYTIDHKINTEYIMTYSDDIDVILRIPNCTSGKMDEIIYNIRDFYILFGQLIKIPQTQLSGTRLTMLKNHYITGEYSATTVKRLCSMSMFSSKDVYSEHIETEAISATASSALEGCETVYTVALFKYVYLLMVTHISFANAIVKYNTKSTFVSRLLDNRFKRIIQLPIKKPNNLFSIEEFTLGSPKIFNFADAKYKVFYRNDIRYISKNDQMSYNPSQNPELHEELINMIILVNYRVNSKLEVVQWFYRIMKTNVNHQLLWLMNVHMPISIGGKGVPPMMNQVISGHSESRAKTWLFLHKLYDYLSIDIGFDFYAKEIYKYFYLLNKDDKINNYEALISGNSPIHITSKTHKDLDKSEVINYLMKMKYRNIDIKNYIRLYKDRSNLASKLILLNKDRFTYRIVRKYMDMSAVSLIEKFIQKLESSSTVLKFVLNNRMLYIQNIFQSAIKAYDTYYCQKEIKHINYTYNPELNLLHIKCRNFPMFSFTDILEPTYDYSFSEQVLADDLTVYLQDQKEATSSGLKIRNPAYSKSIKPKYQIRHEMDYHFNSPAEYNIFECARYTKWVIYSSLMSDNQAINFLQSNNIVNSCNLILSDYTNLRYTDIESYVMTPTGGEIFHRTDNQGFKSSSAVRIMPKDSGSVFVSHTLELQAKTCGEDSNVNYDYLRCRLISLSLIRMKYSTFPAQFCLMFNKYYQNSYRDVRQSFIYEMDLINYDKSHLLTSVDIINQDKFMVISDLLKSGLDITEIEFSIGTLGKKGAYLGLLDSQIALAYRMMKLYLSDSKCIEYNDIKSTVRYSFSKYINAALFSEKYGVELSLSEFDKIMLLMITNERKEFFVYRSDLESAILEQIKKVYSKDYKKMYQMSSNMNLLRSVVRVKRSLMYCLRLAIINDFLVYHVIKNDELFTIDVDVQSTINLTRVAISHARMLKFPLSSDHVFNQIYKFMDKDLFDSILEPTVNSILMESREWKFKGFKIDEITLRGTTVMALKTVIMEKYYDFQYTRSNIDVNELYNLNDLNKMIQWFEHIVKAHASLKSFDSPTGSQALQSQYNYFKELRSYNPHIMEVSDFCAGRGDGHLALTKLGIKHNSYSRGDPYDILSCVDGIIYDEDINIYKLSTLRKYLGCKLAHFDISFIKEKGDLWSVFIDLLDMGINVSVRLNWLNDSPSIDQLKKLNNCKLSVFLPPNERVTSSHIYLLIECTTPFVKVKKFDSNKTILMEMIKNMALNIRKYDPFIVDSDVEINTNDNMILCDELINNRIENMIKAEQPSGIQYNDMVKDMIYALKHKEFIDKYICTTLCPQSFKIKGSLLVNFNGDSTVELEKESSLQIKIRNAEKIQENLIYCTNLNDLYFSIPEYNSMSLMKITDVETLQDWDLFHELVRVSHTPPDYRLFCNVIDKLLQSHYLSIKSLSNKSTRFEKLLRLMLSNLSSVFISEDKIDETYDVIIKTLIIMKVTAPGDYIRASYLYLKTMYYGYDELKSIKNLLLFRSIAHKIDRFNISWFIRSEVEGKRLINKPRIVREHDLEDKMDDPEFFLSSMDDSDMATVIRLLGFINFNNEEKPEHDISNIKDSYNSLVSFMNETMVQDMGNVVREAAERIHQENIELYGEDYDINNVELDEYDIIEYEPECSDLEDDDQEDEFNDDYDE